LQGDTAVRQVRLRRHDAAAEALRECLLPAGNPSHAQVVYNRVAKWYIFIPKSLVHLGRHWDGKFGVFIVILVFLIFLWRFWYICASPFVLVVPRKIWQPWFRIRHDLRKTLFAICDCMY
jgi:hypothetical protein